MEVLDRDVGLLGEPLEDFEVFRVFEVEGNGVPVAVQILEIRTVARLAQLLPPASSVSARS